MDIRIRGSEPLMLIDPNKIEESNSEGNLLIVMNSEGILSNIISKATLEY